METAKYQEPNQSCRLPLVDIKFCYKLNLGITNTAPAYTGIVQRWDCSIFQKTLDSR